MKNYSPKLFAWLKKLMSNHEAKKASVFEAEELARFWRDAPNTPQMLMVKLAMAFGYYGTLRTASEMTTIRWESIKKTHEGYWVSFQAAKTRKTTTQIADFLLPKLDDQSICPCVILESYRDCLPTDRKLPGVFRTYRVTKGGKGTFIHSQLGQNSISKFGIEVATFLELSNPSSYTGHCWRRTSATAMADAGASIEQLKTAGRWRSTTAAEGYLANSKLGKRTRADLLTSVLVDKAEKNMQIQPPPAGSLAPIFNITIQGNVEKMTIMK